LAVAAVIVWRKMPFLRKLTPESHEMGDTWLHDMAPEAIEWWKHINWQEYRHRFLVEFEKVLRFGRNVVSNIDQASDRLARKVRRGHIEAARQVQEHKAQIEAEVQARQEDEADPDELDTSDPEQLKMREQSLIVQIAQNPKDAQLYSELARVYMKLRNYNDAIESLAAAAKIEPENQAFTRRLEFARKRLGEQQSTG
jgi:tetratricopeptide (TPR) repeat protein